MKVYIYGAGEKGKHAVDRISQYYKNEIDVAGFIDRKKTGVYCGFPVYKVEDVIACYNQEQFSIIIAVASRKSAVEIYKEIWKREVFVDCYLYNAKDNEKYGTEEFLINECKRLNGNPNEIIPHIELHAVDYCNLNCAGCVHFSPIYPRTLPDLEKRIEDIHKVCSISNNILSLFILGGEPLLNTELDVYITTARKLLPYADIQLVTNGLLIPYIKNNLLRTIKEKDIIVAISEYAPTSNMKERIVGVLKEHKIDYTIRRYDRKQKFNKPLTTNLHSRYERLCISDGCVSVKEGQIARCPTLMYIKEFNEQFHMNFPTDGIYDLDEIYSCKDLNEKMARKVPLCDYCVKNEMDWHVCNKKPSLEDFVSYD